MDKCEKVIFNIFLTIFIWPAIQCDVKPPVASTDIFTQTVTIGDCRACKLFIDSFKKGLARTERGKYEGGDTAWEEEKLKKSYKRSEMRLIDIQENICEDLTEHSVSCHHIAEKAEEYIETWWAQDADESADLHTYICIDKLKVCCPKHHYGHDCTPCLGNHDLLCSGNGRCRGDGTRKGNGLCKCNPGYSGEQCQECAEMYYRDSNDENKITCLPCDKACSGSCRGGTSRDCAACSPGYTFNTEVGCIDVNECRDETLCTKNQLCVNAVGSYACLECDKSCDGCHGIGPDMCRRCAKDYTKEGDVCTKYRTDETSEKMTVTRNEEL